MSLAYNIHEVPLNKDGLKWQISHPIAHQQSRSGRQCIIQNGRLVGLRELESHITLLQHVLMHLGIYEDSHSAVVFQLVCAELVHQQGRDQAATRQAVGTAAHPLSHHLIQPSFSLLADAAARRL